MIWLLNAVSWIRREWKRVLFYVGVVVFGVLLSVGIAYFVNGGRNRVCLEEAEAMKQQWLAEQTEMDRINYEGMLDDREQTIIEQDETINALQKKIASDSIKHMSDLDAVRAINSYIKAGNGRLAKPG